MHGAGALIAFVCAPGIPAIDIPAGQVPRNGLFTKYLLRHIKTPNEDIRMILSVVRKEVKQDSKSRQIPFVSDGLLEKNISLCDQPR
ncbi:unnamed protein product, partial [Rotaria magnacalcarata]